VQGLCRPPARLIDRATLDDLPPPPEDGMRCVVHSHVQLPSFSRPNGMVLRTSGSLDPLGILIY